MEAIIKKLEELRNYKDELNDKAMYNCDIDYSISLIQTQTTIETLEWVLEQDFVMNHPMKNIKPRDINYKIPYGK
jgi:hypothetical protein